MKKGRQRSFPPFVRPFTGDGSTKTLVSRPFDGRTCDRERSWLFFYDIDFGDTILTPEDLPKIEAEMQKIVKEDLVVKRTELSKADAIKKFQSENEPYKVELIQGFDAESVSLYGQGEWYDLCRGPHIARTGQN